MSFLTSVSPHFLSSLYCQLSYKGMTSPSNNKKNPSATCHSLSSCYKIYKVYKASTEPGQVSVRQHRLNVWKVIRFCIYIYGLCLIPVFWKDSTSPGRLPCPFKLHFTEIFQEKYVNERVSHLI